MLAVKENVDDGRFLQENTYSSDSQPAKPSRASEPETLQKCTGLSSDRLIGGDELTRKGDVADLDGLVKVAGVDILLADHGRPGGFE